ncbi:MAG TPA: cell wall hydrolase [Azospirillaceae bacterium]|nr:cell wall hydrolase [Azospirillaceae bacterium]
MPLSARPSIVAGLLTFFLLATSAGQAGAKRLDEERQPQGDAVQCVALAVYFEARGEPPAGQRAVAAVVMNRTRHPAFPDHPCDVVWQRNANGCQFAWACALPKPYPTDLDAWDRAVGIAERAVAGRLSDPTGGALYFHNSAVDPYWRHAVRPVGAVGGHRFYR